MRKTKGSACLVFIVEAKGGSCEPANFCVVGYCYQTPKSLTLWSSKATHKNARFGDLKVQRLDRKRGGGGGKGEVFFRVV